jgi:hypothetical protein
MASLSDDREAGRCHSEMLNQARDVRQRLLVLPGNMVAMLRANAWRCLVRPQDSRVFVNSTVADWVLGPAWPGLAFPDWATLYALLQKNLETGDECLERLQAAGAPSPAEAERAFQAKRATAKRVRIDRGPIDASHPAEDVPTAAWPDLIRQRRMYLAVELPHVCREVLRFVADAEHMWQALGYASREDLITNGYEITPADIRWAFAGLNRWKPEWVTDLRNELKAG